MTTQKEAIATNEKDSICEKLCEQTHIVKAKQSTVQANGVVEGVKRKQLFLLNFLQCLDGCVFNGLHTNSRML